MTINNETLERINEHLESDGNTNGSYTGFRIGISSDHCKTSIVHRHSDVFSVTVADLEELSDLIKTLNALQAIVADETGIKF